MTPTTCTTVKSDVIDVATTTSSQGHTTCKSTTATAATANTVSESCKLPDSCCKPTYMCQVTSNGKTSAQVSKSTSQCVSTCGNNIQQETAPKAKPSKTGKTILGKRPASNPVLIAPAPAKIPAMSPSVVDISQVITVEKNQQPLNNFRSNVTNVSNNCGSNHQVTPTINLVSMLPVGLPTPSPSPRKLTISKLSKALKGSKKPSTFTVASLLGSTTPKRTRIRRGPSVAHIKPPVLNFINTSSATSTTQISRENITATSLTPCLQAPFVSSGPGFISPLMLPQTQLYLSSNGMAPARLRLPPTASMQGTAQSLGINPSALHTQPKYSTQSLVIPASKASASPLTISFPSLNVPTTLPSLTNLPASQSAFFSSRLPSVHGSQLFSSIHRSLPSPFSFPVVSTVSSSMSSCSVSSSLSLKSSTTTPSFTTQTKPSSISSSTASSASIIAQASSFRAAKGGLPAPSSSMSSPPPAASASPTPAAVPVQQSQTQGADSGFAHSPSVATNGQNNDLSSKTPAAAHKIKAKVNCGTNQALKAGSNSKGPQSSQNNNNAETSVQKNSNIFKPGPAFAHSQGKANNCVKPSLAAKRNAATAFQSNSKEDSLSSSTSKRAKMKETSASSGLSCLPSSPLTSPGRLPSIPVSKSSVSPASALAQLCITSPTSQTTPSSSSIRTPTSFVFPATPTHTCDKSESNSKGAKPLTNGNSNSHNTTPLAPNSTSVAAKSITNGSGAHSETESKNLENTLKSSTTTSGPISPTGRSLKPKKKIADIANTLHKRVSESLQAQSSNSLPQNKTTNLSETISSSYKTSAKPSTSSILNSVDLQRSRSDGGFVGGGMQLPVAKPLLPPPSSSTSDVKQRGSSTTTTITCARHELPGRPLSLQNASLAKGVSTCLASRAEPKRTPRNPALVRSSTPNSALNNNHSGFAQVEEQPLNLVKRDSSFPCVPSGIVLADMKHAVK
ncbi:hypothetical protein EGW08_004290 [Elysia chlorotica]|uniref:Uncharacterized protein n=1 Tax=Elysia chlorotica TaxID=188477 RepID=A0A433U2B0_ELYCH|nr:hypothetical protein EGW08_004290 [Elysia chlorotica]